MSNYLSSPIRIIDRSISRNRLISWSSILQKYADPAGIIAAYPLSSSLFVPLENYHLVTILGAAPSITYPRGQVCARHSLLCASISLHSPLSRLLFLSFPLLSRFFSIALAGSHDFTRSLCQARNCFDDLRNWCREGKGRTRKEKKKKFVTRIINSYNVYLLLSYLSSRHLKRTGNK